LNRTGEILIQNVDDSRTQRISVRTMKTQCAGLVCADSDFTKGTGSYQWIRIGTRDQQRRVQITMERVVIDKCFKVCCVFDSVTAYIEYGKYG